MFFAALPSISTLRNTVRVSFGGMVRASLHMLELEMPTSIVAIIHDTCTVSLRTDFSMLEYVRYFDTYRKFTHINCGVCRMQ